MSLVQNKKVLASILASITLFAVSTPARAATSGAVIISVNQDFTSPIGTAVVTGAIGDYGTIQGADANGKVSKLAATPNALIKLKKGTLLIDATSMNKATSSAPLIQNTTCSFSLTATTVPWPIIKGTGAYKSVKGTLSVTLQLGGITPLYSAGPNKGKCDFSNKFPPVASYFNVLATGTITY